MSSGSVTHDCGGLFSLFVVHISRDIVGVGEVDNGGAMFVG